jgi:predicted ribosome quality control (RQC) complex YloA/Tae2 family protein
MHQQLIQSIVDEVRHEALGNFFGKIFQLGPLSLAIDLGLRGRFLYLSAEPSSPRFYLVQRKGKDLEKESVQLSHFGQLLKSQLGGGRLVDIRKDQAERIVRLTFMVEDEIGRIHFRRLVAQLTGRAANVFVLNELDQIVAALRSPKGEGQSPGEKYFPPPQKLASTREEVVSVTASPSAAADEYFRSLDEAKRFDDAVSVIRGRLKQTKDQKIKLRKNLLRDLESHGDPDAHKKLGDLLLANLSTAVRAGKVVQIIDFYADDAPTIEVEIEDNETLQEAAAKSFRQYTKAKRAHEEIAERLRQLDTEISSVEARERELEAIARSRDEEALARLSPAPKPQPAKKAKPAETIPGVRRYLSSDGYEILVGRGSRDNDHLTFRVAKPNDLWLHTGDYPGSHVVVRNPNRTEIPQRTVIEAAQLAGRFSQANEDSKVVVHYTQRKYLSKPKGAAPGLVRLSTFKSITVEPKESVSRI